MHYQGIDGYVYNVLENEKIAGGGEGTFMRYRAMTNKLLKFFVMIKRQKIVRKNCG